MSQTVETEDLCRCWIIHSPLPSLPFHRLPSKGQEGRRCFQHVPSFEALRLLFLYCLLSIVSSSLKCPSIVPISSLFFDLFNFHFLLNIGGVSAVHVPPQDDVCVSFRCHELFTNCSLRNCIFHAVCMSLGHVLGMVSDKELRETRNLNLNQSTSSFYCLINDQCIVRSIFPSSHS